MSTLGKWWGRTKLSYKVSPAWVPTSYYPIGSYVYEPVTGKWFGLFTPVQNDLGTHTVIIREKFSTSNLATINYLGQNIAYGNSMGLFAYGGFLYGIRNAGNRGAIILYKVDPTSGTATDVKTIYTGTGLTGPATFCFDGAQTVYFGVTDLNAAGPVILKYDLVSDIVTTMATINLGGSIIPLAFGAGVDATYVSFIGQYLSNAYTLRVKISDNSVSTGSFALGSYAALGYRGFYFSSSDGIIKHTSDATTYNFGIVPDAVFVDDSQGLASPRFFIFYHSGGTTYFIETDGATVKNTLSLTGTAISVNRGVYATRPAANIEGAASIVIHEGGSHWEAVSKMKEVI